MAIPNNYIDKIKKDGDSRMISPAADMVRVDNDNFEGADLDEVLDEVAQAIEEAGEGGYTPPVGGIPKTDLASDVQASLGKADTALQSADKSELQTAITSLQNALNTLIGSNNVQGAIDTFNEVKAFLDGIDTDDPTLANQLLALNNAISAVQTSLTAKANSADVYTKSEVDTKVADAGKVKSVTINGTTKTPDASGDVNLGTIVGEKGEKGDTGNVEITDAGDMVALIVNDLTTGGAGNFLSAEMGVRLKQNVDAVQANIVKLYTKLANMAFWNASDRAEAAPTALDWQVPKKTLTITNSIPNSVISYNGTVVSGNLLVDAGDTIILLVGGTAGYEIESVTAQGATVVNNGDGTFTVRVRVNDDMTLAISGSSVMTWRTLPHDDVTENGTVIMYGIQQGRSMMAENASTGRGHMTSGLSGLDTGIPLVASAPAGMPAATKVFTTSKPDGVHTESNPGDTEAYYLSTGGKRYLNVRYSYSGSAFNEINMAVGCFTNDVIGNVYVNNGHTAGFVGRYPYGVPTSGTAWKIDLNTFATQKGFTAGSITYVKLLLAFNQGSTAVDTRTVINDLVVKYKFTDD